MNDLTSPKKSWITIQTIFVNILLLSFLLLYANPGFSQAEGEEEEETVEVLKSRMSLSIYQRDNDTLSLKALVRAKIDRSFVGLEDLDVVFTSVSDTLSNKLGTATTNSAGIAELRIPASSLLIDTAGQFTVEAKFKGNDKFKKSDDDLSFYRAAINLNFEETDSTRKIIATLVSGGEPVEDKELILFMKSLFLPYKIAEANTDSEGKAEFDFPMDLPGNQDGIINLYVQLNEDDDLGYVESYSSLNWGVRIEKTTGETKRELWSVSPPLWLLILFTGLLAVIWLHYVEVVFDLFKIKKAT